MGKDTLAPAYPEAIALREWKSEMKEIIYQRYGKLSDKKVDAYLNKVIEKQCRNPKMVLVNNYRNQEIKTNLLQVIDYIEEYQLIIGGGACLFHQHPKDPDKIHVCMKFIQYIMKERKKWKKIRDELQKGTLDWINADLGQNNKKLKINALYGCLGCKSFILFNRFLAASITNCGRQIICTAAMTFENYLGVEVKYNFEGEVFTFIKRIRNEIKRKFPNGIDTSPFYVDSTRPKVKEKLLSRCAFFTTPEFIEHLDAVLATCSIDELTIIYYKNNLMEFSKTEPIRRKLKRIMSGIKQMRKPDIDVIEDAALREEILDLELFYQTFVQYTEPMFDRVRKTMFSDRDKVLYTDTDSTFLALNLWVTFIKEDILENYYSIPEMEMNFIAVNVMTYILGAVIASGLMNLCLGMNVTEEWAKLLTMKNEFYLYMIVFTNAKKRYISDAILQEGVLLVNKKTGVIGYPEIKGFDFKKAVVKPYVTEYYTKLAIEDILRTPVIRVDQIYMKMLKLKSDIEASIRGGSSEYYKQAKVQLIEQYKKPYQVQGIRAVLLWNCLFPDMQMELPVDVDIVPIKVISDAKGRAWLESVHPDLYKRVKETFFDSSNELMRNMELKVIARPKNNTDLPSWFFDLIDETKIVSDIMSLFYPIMESLGLHTNKVGKKTYLTNMVDL